MRRQIFKYEISPNNTIVEMPKGAKILTVQNQFEQCCIWAFVDPFADTEKRCFVLVATGQVFYDRSDLVYIGTFQLQGGGLVFHLFEITKP